jgi:hypothetical protein
MKKLIASLMLGLAGLVDVRGEAMLQLFQVSWRDLIDKMPELAEAGYTSLWLPPPTKAGGGYSTGYDLFDPFDLGDKDQRGSIATRYGTKDELLRMVRMAHRFGLRVYFDNIMNHRGFDIPGYNEYTPITIYPGMLPEDFHMRTTADGFFRNPPEGFAGDEWNDVWKLQNRVLSDLCDISQETPNANFGAYEGATNPKISFVRQPNNPEYYMDNDLPAIAGPWKPFNGASGDPVVEDVNSYNIRAVMYLLAETHCDGFRFDAVKHVPAYFFGDYLQSTANGYTGAVQTMYDYIHGYGNNVTGNGYVEGDDNRNSCFDAEAVRNDALMFGEHVGSLPGSPLFTDYLGRGMRLLDFPVRDGLHKNLGNGYGTLAGLDSATGGGGFSPYDRVMFAQNHDAFGAYAVHRELQLPFYFMREGIAAIYSDNYNKAETCRDCGGAFPSHANANYLGEFGDNKMPDIVTLHNQLARGGTRGRWSDADIVAFERYEYREGITGEANKTVVLFAMNDRYDYPGDIAFVDGDGETFPSGASIPSGANNNKQGLVVQFPVGSILYQLADSPGKERAYSQVRVRWASNNRSWVQEDPANRVYVGAQTVPADGGGIEILIPSGGYVIYAYQPPQPSRPASGVMDQRAITFEQDGQEVPRMLVRRKDGRDGDQSYNPTYPYRMRGSVDIFGNVVGGANVSNLTYAIDIPVITNTTPINIVLRADASASNITVRLDGGMDLNSHMGFAPTTGFDKRDKKPGTVYDHEIGYESAVFRHRYGPEKFAAVDTGNRNRVVSLGAETYQYTVSGTSALIPGGTGGPNTSSQTAAFVYHDPVANVTVAGGGTLTTQRNPQVPGVGQSADVWVKVGYQNQANKCFIYYTTDGSNPEGAFGTGKGATQVAEGTFQGDDNADSTIDWWRGTIPAQSDGTTVKYKVALFKQGIAPMSDADTAKVYGQTVYAITNFNPLTALCWLHADLKTNETVVGLEEGYHIARSHPYLLRLGQSTAFNTFLQTFYYDPTPPTGAIAFPANDGDGLFSQEYGVVVRADANTTEVEYNISDGDPNNDDVVTGFPNGNGLSNGVPVFAKASQVSPYPALGEQFPDYPLEYRFNYVGIPSNGTANITVRLKELTSATFTSRVTELHRNNLQCHAPPQTLQIAFPSFNGETITLDQNDKYTLVICATDTLNVLTNYTIKIDGAVQPRNAADGTPLYRFEGNYCGAGKLDLRYDWAGMGPGQHLIEVAYSGSGLNLQASRLVNVVLSGVAIDIVSPPASNPDGSAPYLIVLPDRTNATPAERSFTILTDTSTNATSVTISFSPVTNVFAGGSAALDTSFVGSSRQWEFAWTNLVQGEFIIRADALGQGSNTAFRTARVVFRQIVPEDPNDDDDDDDGLNDLSEANAQPLPTSNQEFWVNGDVHAYFFSGKSDPINCDTDNDGLPDALELGLGGSVASNTDTNADTNGDGIKNFLIDKHPPVFNTYDNQGVDDFDETKPRTDIIGGSMTDPSNPDTDSDGLLDGIEDANRDGRVDITVNGVLQTNPPTNRGTSMIDRTGLPGNAKYLETDPANPDSDGDSAIDGAEDVNHNGIVDGDTNADGLWQNGEAWTETDPRNRDCDGDGLLDGWEIQYGLDPLNAGTFSMRTADGSGGNPDYGATGNLDGDSANNLQEQTNGTNPLVNDDVPPPIPNSINIGAGPVIGTTGGVTWNEEFQDWTIDDLKALDEHDGAGSLKRSRDVYPCPTYDYNKFGCAGSDYSRDIVAFYARDGGDGKYYFRVDFHDLVAGDEQSAVNAYVVIDTGNPNIGEVNLPDDVDAKTDMRWEVVVACYGQNFGNVYIRDPQSGTVSVRGYNPNGTGFLGAYWRGDLDAVEFGISRQALLDAGWTGGPLQFQVFTTRDDTSNSACGGPCGGDLGGRTDIADSIYDDDIAESDTLAPKETLGYWFTSINYTPVNISNYQNSLVTTQRPNAVELAVLLHGNQAILPAGIIHGLVSNSVTRTPTGTYPAIDPGNNPTGYFRALESSDVFGTPLNLHLSGSLISALQWAKTDPALDATGSRDGEKFNQRVATMVDDGRASLLSGMFADHITSYFTGAVNRAAVRLQDDIMRGVYGNNAVSSDSPLYVSERVIDGPTLTDLAANSGHNFVVLDQQVHLWWWAEQLYGFGNGRLTALGDDGYRINRFNGLRTFLISGASQEMFYNTDFALTLPLRQLLVRKALSGNRDQIVILGDNWETAAGIGGGSSNPDRLNINLRWIANHPWIHVVGLDRFGTGNVDINNDGQINGLAGDWPNVIERGNANFTMQAKDLIRHNSRTNYNNWYYGLAGAEESFYAKQPPIRAGINTTKIIGHVLTNGTIMADAWLDADGATGTLSNLARLVYLNGVFETAFHDEDNNNYERFSTGEYKYPDTTGFDTLSVVAYKSNSRVPRQAGIPGRAAVWAQSSPPSTPTATQEDVDHDGEVEYILSNNRVYAVFERIGGRLIAAFVRDPATGNAYQTVGNLVSAPEYETETEGDTNLNGASIHAYRTSGLKDWFAVTNSVSGFGTTRYVNDLYNVTSVANGWQFTSPDGKITKTITLADGDNKLETGYTLTGGVSKLYVRSGLAPDLENLVMTGQKNLSGPVNASGKVSLTNSNTASVVTVSLNYADGGAHVNTSYNSAASDDGGGSGILSVKMRNQAQTQQIELESTSTTFGFAVAMSAAPPCVAGDDDADGLTNCDEVQVYGTNPNNADTDGDGMRDGWEVQYNRNPLLAGNGSADPDGDGQGDLAESIANTNPDDSSSSLRVTNVSRTGSNCQVFWTTVAGTKYQVHSATSLPGAVFTPLSGVITATGSSTNYTDTGASGSAKYYRIQIVP